ncbi:MAG: fused DSP-PTPase phosphatase/NAD kinase-like protein [Blastocatellia bacterium]
MKPGIFSNQAGGAAFVIFFACALAFATHAVASQQRMADDADAIEIENFGKVNDHFYRGAQPKERHYRQLAALGVKTIVDLRADALPQARAEAERAGLRYLNLPLQEKRCPRADAAGQFLKIVTDQTNGTSTVTCFSNSTAGSG